MNELISQFIFSYFLPCAILLISILSLYYSALRGAKIRIAEVVFIDFYPKFSTEGTLVDVELEVPIVVINEGVRIGVLSDLHLFIKSPKFTGRIRTEKEVKEFPCPIKNQESAVFFIRTGPLPIEPEVKYEGKIIGITAKKKIHSSFTFLLKKEKWERIVYVKEFHRVFL